jgi:hypothetical protein
VSEAITFKNVSRFGDLDLPLLGRVVEHGEEFELPLEQALLLRDQPDLWEHVAGDFPEDTSYDALKVDELRALLADRSLDTSGKKSDLIARLEEADQAAADHQGANQ